jgi:hypothetical protein
MRAPSSRSLRKRACKHLIGKRISRDRAKGCRERNESEESRAAIGQIFLAPREIALPAPRNAMLWTLCNIRRAIGIFLRQKMT